MIGLEKSTNKIPSVRKKMMLIGEKVMTQYGADAFRLGIRPGKNSQSPQRESPTKSLLQKHFVTTSTDRDVNRDKLLSSLNDAGD